MSIRLGSNEYFKLRETKTDHINKIGAGNAKGKLKGLEKLCATVSRLMRKCLGCIMDKHDWKARVTDRVDSLKEKCNRQQITHITEVDNHVNQMIKGVQQEAFDSFMGKIPNFKNKLNALRDFDDELIKHQPLLDALNAINGQIKLDACVALASIESILAGVKKGDGEGPEVDEFYTKIEELKVELANKDSAENKAIAENLANLTNALDIWDAVTDKHTRLVNFDTTGKTDVEAAQQRTTAINQYNTAQTNALNAWDRGFKSIENLLSDEGRNKAQTIPVAREWAVKMKAQKAKLILKLDPIKKEYTFKRHGFFQDRVDEAKKIAKAQHKELRNLDLSFTNYLADQTNDLWSPLADDLKKAKNETVQRNEKNIKEAEEGIIKYANEPEKLSTLNQNKALYEKNQEIFQKFWNLDGSVAEVAKKKAKIAKLTKKVNKAYSEEKANKIAALYAESAEKLKAINTERVVYSVKSSFATLSLAFKDEQPLGIADDANLLECDQVLKVAGPACIAFNDLLDGLEYLEKEKKNDFTLENWANEDGEIQNLTFGEAQAWALEKYHLYYEAGNKADARVNTLQHEIIGQSLTNASIARAGAAEDQLFLDQLLLTFDLVQTSDDGNCFFHAIKAGLDRLDDPRFDQFKAMSSEQLRTALYNHMKANPGDFQMSIAQFLSVDVLEYANAALDQAPVLLLQKAPAMRQLYTDVRNEYQPLNSVDRSATANGLFDRYFNDETVIAYAEAMSGNTTYVDLTEALVMSQMLNIQLNIHSKSLPGDSLLFGGADLPLINILRPKNKPHFELLVEKPQVLDAEPVTT